MKTLIISMLLAALAVTTSGCAKRICGNIDEECDDWFDDMGDGFDWNDACEEAYKDNRECAKALREFEDCVKEWGCDSSDRHNECGFEWNMVDNKCGDIRDEFDGVNGN